MFEVGVSSHFSAAHHLVGYNGKCAAHHGHNWGVDVSVCGPDLDDSGFLLDFSDLKDGVRRLLDRLDHTDLNALEVFGQMNPTSENIARYLFEQLSGELDCDTYRVCRVSVHETPGTTATYTRSG